MENLRISQEISILGGGIQDDQVEYMFCSEWKGRDQKRPLKKSGDD